MADETLAYDLTSQRQVLTKEAVQNQLGYDLTAWIVAPITPEIFLKEISDDCYNWLSVNSLTNNYRGIIYLFATQDDWKLVIEQAMLAHCRYSLRGKAYLLKDQTGINIQQGEVIEIDNIRNDVNLALPSIQLFKSKGLTANNVILVNFDPLFVEGVDW